MPSGIRVSQETIDSILADWKAYKDSVDADFEANVQSDKTAFFRPWREKYGLTTQTIQKYIVREYPDMSRYFAHNTQELLDRFQEEVDDYPECETEYLELAWHMLNLLKSQLHERGVEVELPRQRDYEAEMAAVAEEEARKPVPFEEPNWIADDEDNPPAYTFRHSLASRYHEHTVMPNGVIITDGHEYEWASLLNRLGVEYEYGTVEPGFFTLIGRNQLLVATDNRYAQPALFSYVAKETGMDVVWGREYGDFDIFADDRSDEARGYIRQDCELVSDDDGNWNFIVARGYDSSRDKVIYGRQQMVGGLSLSEHRLWGGNQRRQTGYSYGYPLSSKQYNYALRIANALGIQTPWQEWDPQNERDDYRCRIGDAGKGTIPPSSFVTQWVYLHQEAYEAVKAEKARERWASDSREWQVYRHVSPSGKSYIGITSRENARMRWGHGGIGYSGQNFWRAIEKYGWDNISHYVFTEDGWCEETVIASGEKEPLRMSCNDACQKEVELIAEYDSYYNGYNCTKGGDCVPRA